MSTDPSFETLLVTYKGEDDDQNKNKKIDPYSVVSGTAPVDTGEINELPKKVVVYY